MHVQSFLGGGVASRVPCGVTVMEERKILVGWVTKSMFKMYIKAGVGRDGDIFKSS